MQFRAGILYVVLFVVVAAGAYGVIATAESPEVTIDEANADYTLEAGEEFEVDGQTLNVSQLSAHSGTVEYVNESAVLEVQWEGQGDDDWNSGDSVMLGDSEDDEYTVMIIQPGGAEDNGEDDGGNENEGGDGNETAGGGNESEGDDGNETAGDGNESEGESGNESAEGDDGAEPQAFMLIEAFDEEEYETVEREGQPYIVVSENDSEELVHVTEFDEIDTQVYETGDSIEFYDEENEEMTEGNVTDISADMVTVEYIGTEVDEYDLVDTETVILNDQEFGVYFPSDEQVYLTSDLEAFQAQQASVEDHGDRIRGLWWVVSLAVLTAIVIAGLAFMPVRG